MKRLEVIVLLLFVSLPLFAQVEVFDKDATQLESPWCGGLNACQFGRLDLNADGKKDLIVFDRHGNRVLCFLNFGANGQISYEYAPEYSRCFPAMYGWAQFVDYDGDGREDIFTYSKGWAGIKVFRNVTNDTLAFQLVKSPYLTSLQGGGEVNIISTDADYPAIIDLDGDGDLDILTFWSLGTFIEEHVNMSMERYGNKDSLCFVKTDFCWGRVAENEENNLMYLDTCMFDNMLEISKNDYRHRGATFAVHDLTGDGLPDLLLADVDYAGLTLLVNGGDSLNALMVSQTDDFPTTDRVHLFSMPVCSFTDVNNDGIDDLLVSPFDPNPMASEGQHSVWLYLNHGSSRNPDFQLYSKSFLQDQMIDVGTGAYPVFTDVDADGLLDLIVGDVGDIDSSWYHYGSLQTHRSSRLRLYRNTGSAAQPSFQMTDDDFGSLKSIDRMGLVPAFGDIDLDGKNEAIVGSSSGELLYFDSDWNLIDDNFLNFSDTWSAPCLYDVDDDGIVDLIVGGGSGKLSYYHGSSDGTHIVFTLIDDFWGEVDVRDHDVSYYGYSVPALFKLDGELLLAVGSEQGKLFLYSGLDGNLNGHFVEVSERWPDFINGFCNGFGMRSSVSVADLHYDGGLVAVVGNFGGGLQLYNASASVSPSVKEQSEDLFSVFPNPAQAQLSVSSRSGRISMISVFDGMGRCVYVKHIDSQICTIDIGGLGEGMYVVVATTDNGVIMKKVVTVQR